MVYDPKTKKLSSLVATYRNQLFKGPNDLDFDAEGNLYFTDPWGTGAGPDAADRTGAVYQYSRQGVLRRVISTGEFPNGIAVSPDDGTLAVADYAANRMLSCPFSIGLHENSRPDFLFPVDLADAGMRGGGRALSDG